MDIGWKKFSLMALIFMQQFYVSRQNQTRFVDSGRDYALLRHNLFGAAKNSTFSVRLRHSKHQTKDRKNSRDICSSMQNIAYRLHCELLKDYRKSTPPVENPMDPIKVQLYVALYQIITLDQVRNTIVLSGSFELFWHDTHLMWNPEEYEGTSQIFLSSDDIWTPEISLYYSHHAGRDVVMQSNNDARLNYTGHLRYYIPFTSESICPIDVQMFPFDKQTCSLFFGSWAHSNESLIFVTSQKLMDVNDFYDNQEWVLIENSSSLKQETWIYEYLGSQLWWSIVIMKVSIQRQSFYYVFNLVIPSTIITIVAIVGFHMPSTSGRVRDAKFRLGIITLMSMSVILLAIVEDMPKFSMGRKEGKRGSFSGVPLIGIFYFSLLTIIGLSTITTSLFVLLERNIRVQKMVPWYLRFLLGTRRTRYSSYSLTAGSARKPSRFGTTVDIETNESPRHELKRKLSMGHYDNMIIFHYFHDILEDLTTQITSIDRALQGIRHELLSLLPQDDLDNQWLTIIRRLELISLAIYLFVVFVILMLFFFNSWYNVEYVAEIEL